VCLFLNLMNEEALAQWWAVVPKTNFMVEKYYYR
jgi:hypothetical protein